MSAFCRQAAEARADLAFLFLYAKNVAPNETLAPIPPVPADTPPFFKAGEKFVPVLFQLWLRIYSAR